MCAKKIASSEVVPVVRPFDFRNLGGFYSGSSWAFRRGLRSPSAPTLSSESNLIHGAVPLCEQIRKARLGGLPLTTRSLDESNYDEDGDGFDVDPTVDRTLDRFERAERIVSVISDRVAKSRKEKLEHADV